MIADDLAQAFATVPPAWRARLPGWTDQAQSRLIECVRAVSGDRQIGPDDPFRALRLVEPDQVKVVLFGQDPYPREGHADGLAFSAGQGRPHSLRRVFQVLAADRPGWEPPTNWCLDDWARQGALLLNPTLTVEIGKPGSHMDCGWQALTSDVVRALCARVMPPVFMLWGRPANAFFDATIPSSGGLSVLRTRHPSHDFRREFMLDDRHFLATAHLVDWWGLGNQGQ